MTELLPRLEKRLDRDALAFLHSALDKPDLPRQLPQLPRRIGTQRLGGGRTTLPPATVDLDAWRLCDAAAFALLHRSAPPPTAIEELFQRGDSEERAMLLRCLALLPLSQATARLLGEAQRSNQLPLFEAAACDHDLLARAVTAGVLPLADLHRMLLKVAFNDLPLVRVYCVERHGNPELSRMLTDFATEREAAGRPVWPDTDLLLARAPCPGTAARILGSLEHGDDRRRLAAAQALALLNRSDLRPFLRERLERERHPAVRQAMQEALG
jgi:hypothetical protein